MAKKKEVSAEEAMAVLQKENEKKLKAFAEEYEELCKKHGLKIIANTQLIVSQAQ